MAFTKTAGVEYGTPAVVLSTTAASGSNQTAIRTDGQIIAFSTDMPEDIAYGQSAATGSDGVAARLDHDHGMAAADAVAQASQAEVEGESDVDKYVPPDMLKFSPGVSKAWCQFHHTDVIDSSYNILSVSNTATGQYTVTYADAMSSSTYVAASLSARGRSLAANDSVAWTTGTARVYYIDTSTGNLIDIATTTLGATRIAFFGDQ